MLTGGRPFRLKWRDVGALLIVLSLIVFVGLNIQELDPGHPWPTPQERFANRWLGSHSMLGLNLAAAIGISGTLFFRSDRHQAWRESGLLIAFMTSLLTEMFGLPLAAFVASRWFAIPLLGDDSFQRFGHWPLTVGMAVAFLGMSLIAWAWLVLYRGRGDLARTGPYRWLRHPQYLGFILYSVGWLVHWPTVVSLVLWPFVAGAFVVAAHREDEALERQYGDRFRAYAAATGFLLPKLPFLRTRTGIGA